MHQPSRWKLIPIEIVLLGIRDITYRIGEEMSEIIVEQGGKDVVVILAIDYKIYIGRYYLFVDGRVFFSGYVYGECADIRYKRKRGKQFKISQLEGIMDFKEYRDEINHIFAHYTKRGFVSYYDCRGLWSDMTSLLTEAIADLKRQGQFKELFDLANKAFLKWAKTDKDDSDGETQDFVCYVFEAWDEVYKSEDSKINHAKMLEWFLKYLDGSVVDYMEDYLYTYILEHFKEEELLNKKLDFLKERIEIQKLSEDKFQMEYHMPRCQIYALKLMAELSYPIEDIRIYAGTIKSFFVKENLAKIELDYGNIAEAIAAYEDLAEREDQRWGKNKYREILMRIYKEQGNQEKYFENLKKALLAAVGDKELWNEYKANFSSDDLPLACEDIFSVLEPGDSRANTWYVVEDRYDLIMNSIETFDDADQLKAYEKKLKKSYPERCLAVLVANAEEVAVEGNKRADYRKLARFLNWIQKYPNGDDISKELAKKYSEEYPRRKAMQEEIMRFI